MPDPFEAARAKKRIFIAFIVLLLVWFLPLVIDYFAQKYAGFSIYKPPTGGKGLQSAGAFIGDLIKLGQWIVTGVVAVIIVFDMLRMVTAE